MGLRRSLLLVGTDPLTARSLARSLAEHYEVLEARTFAEALAALGTRLFDAVISHHDLGEATTGAELLRIVAAMAPKTRRVLLSTAAVACPEAHRVLRKHVTAENIRVCLTPGPEDQPGRSVKLSDSKRPRSPSADREEESDQ